MLTTISRRLAVIALLLPCIAACHNLPAGPSLSSVSITAPSLQSTTGNPGQCCCHIQSTATNANAVAVDLTIKFSAYNKLDPADAFAKIVFFVPNLGPGASSPVDAPGLIVPCAAVDKILYELEVKGLTSPPPM